MILLDTCALLALADGGTQFSDFTRRRLETPGTRVFVSAISAFEIGQKHRSGKIQLKLPPAEWFPAMLRHHQVDELPVSAALALAATGLPAIHRDPFDRLVIATALAHHLKIVTSDRIIPTYPGVETLW